MYTYSTLKLRYFKLANYVFTNVSFTQASEVSCKPYSDLIKSVNWTKTNPLVDLFWSKKY